MPTPVPIAVTDTWTEIGENGFEYLVAAHDGPCFYAYGDTTPSDSVLGYPLVGSLVLTPPGTEKLFARAASVSRVTVTQGSAVV